MAKVTQLRLKQLLDTEINKLRTGSKAQGLSFPDRDSLEARANDCFSVWAVLHTHLSNNALDILLEMIKAIEGMKEEDFATENSEARSEKDPNN